MLDDLDGPTDTTGTFRAEEGGRRESVGFNMESTLPLLPAVQMEGGATSQEKRMASRTGKDKGTDSLLAP